MHCMLHTCCSLWAAALHVCLAHCTFSHLSAVRWQVLDSLTCSLLCDWLSYVWSCLPCRQRTRPLIASTMLRRTLPRPSRKARWRARPGGHSADLTACFQTKCVTEFGWDRSPAELLSRCGSHVLFGRYGISCMLPAARLQTCSPQHASVSGCRWITAEGRGHCLMAQHHSAKTDVKCYTSLTNCSLS